MEINNKRIHVTQEDIHNGICNNPESCAIALALSNELNGCSYVQVDSSEEIIISFEGGGEYEVFKNGYDVYINPDHKSELHDFIRDFDDGKKVKPMSFIIDKIERREE
jgi:hypothetical protein